MTDASPDLDMDIDLFDDQRSYDTIPMGLCVISKDLRFLRINELMAQINGVPVLDHIGRLVSEVVPALEGPARELMREVMQSKAVVGPFEIIGETPADPGNTHYWTEIWSPIFDTHGNVVAASVAALDVTERKLAEQQKEQALRDAERRLGQQTAISELSQAALGAKDLQTVLDKAVEAAATYLQVPLTKILAFQDSGDQLKLVAGVGWQTGLVGLATVGTEAESQAGYTLDEGGLVIVEDLAREQRFSGPALLHQHAVISGMSIPIAGTNGRPYGVFGVHATSHRRFDLGDQQFLISLAAIVSNSVRNQSARSQRTLLIREMAHRAGNMLQLVSSIASQTFRNADNLEKAKNAFSERLSALARANHVIAQEGWGDTRFERVVAEVLAPFPEKIKTFGRDIILPAELSFDLGLVLNELATNSCKYGSLGADNGTVSLSWSMLREEGGDVLQLEWRDVAAQRPHPAKKPSSGFGTRLMSLLVEQKWCGKIASEQQHGYTIKFSIPVSESGNIPHVVEPGSE